MALRCNTSATNDASQEEVPEEGRDWSSLTADLLEGILGHLTSLREFFACSRVCRGWRSIAVPTPHTMSSQCPLLLFHSETPTRFYYDIGHRKPFMFRPPANYDILGYSHGHLIAARYSGRMAILNLFTGAFTRSLPDVVNFGCRVLLSSSPSSPDCLAVSFPELCPYQRYQKIHYYDMSSQTLSWKLGLKCKNIADIIFFQKKLYVLNAKMKLGVLDPRVHPWNLVMLEDGPSQGQFDPLTGIAHPRWILATSGDKLLKICRAPVDHLLQYWDFQSNGGQWVAESNLDGRSFFIGEKGFGGSASISERSGLRQNCIYTTLRCSMFSVYSLQDNKTVETISLTNPSSCRFCKHPVWVLPSLL